MVVAQQTELRCGAIGPLWECQVCGQKYAFMSVMILHLFHDHSLRAVINHDLGVIEAPNVIEQ